MTYDERLARFLELLSAATKETGVRIGGCGCCNSPHFLDLANSRDNGEYFINEGHGPELDWRQK